MLIECPMRNRGPHRQNVENILAICLPIVTMQHIRESSSASHAMRKSAWNDAGLLLAIQYYINMLSMGISAYDGQI